MTKHGLEISILNVSYHMSTTQITDKVLSSFKPTKDFKYHQHASITSLDFDDSGQFLISAGVDKSIQLYDVHKGSHFKDIQSQKYGAHLARFTHHELNCLYALTPTESLEVDHAIRYLSLENKLYIRYFKGHKEMVTSIEVNPIQEMFASSSLDQTVKLWDLKVASPVGNLDIGCTPILAFDPQGIVFAAATDSAILLYDLHNYDKAPFLKVKIPCKKSVWEKVEFSNNGKLILIATNSNEHYIVDAFLGQLLATLLIEEFPPVMYKYPHTGSVTFSPCGKFVLAGTPLGKVAMFDLHEVKSTDGDSHSVSGVMKLYPFKVLNSTVGIPKIIEFNPKLLTFASADTDVALWQPSI